MSTRSAAVDILIENERISRIDSHISHPSANIIEAHECYVLPGLIDTHVHFREPGYPHKGSIATESAAAICGGVTSYLDMPNTLPPTICEENIVLKHRIAQRNSLANYGFYIGATNHNIEQLLSIKAGLSCGVKVFMGSSTGNMAGR